MNIDKEMVDLFEDNGAFSISQKITDEIAESFSGKLPEFLIQLWKKHGIGSWSGGLINLCNPSNFDGLLSQIFHADKDFSHQDCHVFGYSAFGQVLVWSERHWIVEVDLLRGRLSSAGLIYPEKKTDPDMSLLLSILTDNDSLNAYDDNNKPLFARARKKLGALEQGECYGFFPALAMGGAPDLKNLKRVKVLEHFIFLAQLQQFSLIDYLARPISEVRKIG
jgi:hypothetical protein